MLDGQAAWRRLIIKRPDVFENISHLIIWSDGCARQFMCYRTQRFYADLALTLRVGIQYNFFTPGHGKSPVDSHFSVMKAAFRRAKVISTCLHVLHIPIDIGVL